jgi:hypothetical protein
LNSKKIIQSISFKERKMKLYYIIFNPGSPKFQYEVFATKVDKHDEEVYEVVKILKKHEKNRILKVGSKIPVTEKTDVKYIGCGKVEDFPEYFV